jgi:bifunctional N-acetylglucosamine-1-phosphate-uridyltransferase/glucosamine-1-phosphate-acetyltransferase GlmU-like protein
MNTLIVPCAGRSSRFPNMKPKWMLTHPEGMTMLQKNLSAIDFNLFNRIIITILREHDDKYDAALFLKQAFPEDKIEILILDNLTSGPAETVYETLRKKVVKGSFVVRDSDSYVLFSSSHLGDSFLVGMNLNKILSTDRMSDKSFVILDNYKQVKGIVEKKIASDYVCLGVYGFKSSSDFIHAFEELKISQNHKEIYASHVVTILLRNERFHYVEADIYEDWGTLDVWKSLMQRRSSYFFDIDGVLLKNTGKYGKNNWDNTFDPIEPNIQFLRELHLSGAQLILTTSRPEKYRSQIENYFKEKNINIHAIVMGIYHSPRIIVNDFAPTNPYPSCSSVNLPRNGLLEEFFN